MMSVLASPPYRPDIDGLRAIAVLAVILFHARIPGFSGGYVGVDVFFVISGYLITQQLLSGMNEPLGLMLARFYTRRARRILPALFLVVGVVLAVAMFVFLPSDLEGLGRDATLSIVFAGNIAAWTSGGYFDASNQHLPLLHLWTIAIEEQFYLVFPLFFWILHRYLHSSRVSALLVICTLLSFGLCVWAAESHPRANFYLAPTRAWELLLGALLATRLIRAPPDPWKESLAACAMLAIALSVFLYDQDMSYPGYYALTPTLATATLILLGSSTPPLTNRILSIRPVVLVGLASYSLYLWHFPIQTLFEYYYVRELRAVETATWLLLTLILALGSWVYVENPIRRKRSFGSNRHFAISVAACATILAVSSFAFWQYSGLLRKIPVDVRSAIDVRNSMHADTRTCMDLGAERVAAGELCRFGSTDAAEEGWVLWGDSHALALLPALEQMAMEHNTRLYFAGKSACRPLLNVASPGQNQANSRNCARYNLAMLSAIEQLDPALVILASYWTYPDMILRGIGSITFDEGRGFEEGLRAVLDSIELRNRRKCVVLDVPGFAYAVPHAYARAMLWDRSPDLLAMERTEALRRLAPAEAVLRRLAADTNLVLADPKELLCDASTCRAASLDGALLYRDEHHLSVAGARFVTPSLDACLQ